MPVTDVSNLKVADLKRELKVRGLSVIGNKNELQDRLQASLEGEPLLEDTSITGEDILDEEGVLSDEEKILGADENELLQSPTTTPTTLLPKTASPEVIKEEGALMDDDILASPTTTSKKIVLKRKISINSGSTTLDNNATTAKENTEPSPVKAVKMSERNPITMGEPKKEETDEAGAKKLKELSMQERLELRAKKFGIDAKAASADASGISTKEKNAAISVAPVVSSEKQVELLKKRAERFGCVTSTNLAKLDAEEKLLKRKQRFGGEGKSSSNAITVDSDTTTSTTVTLGASTDEWAEKARKRLERFKANSTPTVIDADVSAAVVTATPAAASTST